MAGFSPEVRVTLPENSTPLNNPPSPVPNVPNDPDSNPNPKFSYSYSSDSSDFSDSMGVKRKKCTCKKHCIKKRITNPIEQCAKLKSKLLKASYNSYVT